jgi:hypothetical protein
MTAGEHLAAGFALAALAALWIWAMCRPRIPGEQDLWQRTAAEAAYDPQITAEIAEAKAEQADFDTKFDQIIADAFPTHTPETGRTEENQ